MTTIREELNKFQTIYPNATDYEFYEINRKANYPHTDNLTYIEDVDLDAPIKDTDISCYCMDEEEYGQTVLANDAREANFGEWYDDPNAKVLVITIKEGWEIESKED